eukprot:1193482-Prorocentrum_minimum.AAC.2
MAEEAPARENGPGSGPPPEATDQVLPGEVVSSEPGETSGRTIPLKEVSPPSSPYLAAPDSRKNIIMMLVGSTNHLHGHRASSRA